MRMPVISKIRLVNVKFNDDKRVVPDVVLHLRGNHTLALLQNAGGKTVLNKFFMQPVLSNYDYLKKQDKVYFDIRGFFKTNPSTSYILIEWELEDNNGFLLTGLGMKKGSDGNMAKVSFIHEYTMPGKYSIDNFPVIYEANDGRHIKSPDNMYEELQPLRKKGELFCYKNSNYQHKKEFREKLLEYRINESEWKNIHAKINSMEGGLQELFASCPKTKDLLEQWIIPAIEDKILSDDESEDRLKNIKDRFLNFIENKERKLEELKTLNNYREFKGDMIVVQGLLIEKGKQTAIKINSEGNLANIYYDLMERQVALSATLSRLQSELSSKNEEITNLQYTSLSYEIQSLLRSLENIEKEIQHFSVKIKEVEEDLDEYDRRINLLECAKKNKELIMHRGERDSLLLKLKPLEEKLKEYEEMTCNIKYSLKACFSERISEKQKSVEVNIKLIEENSASLSKAQQSEKKLAEDNKALSTMVSECQNHIGVFLADFNKFKEENSTVKSYLQDKEKVQHEDELLNFLNDISEDKDKSTKELCYAKEGIIELGQSLTDLSSRIKEYNNSLSEKDKAYYMKEIEFKKFIEAEAGLIEKLREFEFTKRDLYNKLFTLTRIEELSLGSKNSEEELVLQNNKIDEKIKFFEESKIPLSDEVRELFKENSIEFEFGLDWIRNYEDKIENKRKLLRKNPIIPYALIVDEANLSRAENVICNYFTDSIIPLLVKSELDNANITKINSLFKIENVSFFAGYSEELIDDEYMNRVIEDLKGQRRANDGKITQLRDKTKGLNMLHSALSKYIYTQDHEGFIIKELQGLKTAIDTLKTSIDCAEAEAEAKNEELEAMNSRRENLNIKINDLIRLEKDGEHILDLYKKYEKALKDKACHEASIDKNSSTLDLLKVEIEKLKNLIYSMNIENKNFSIEIENIRYDNRELLEFTGEGKRLTDEKDNFLEERSLKTMLGEYDNNAEYSDVSFIKERLNTVTASIKDLEDEIKEFHLEEKEYSSLEYSRAKVKEIKNEKSERSKVKDALLGEKGKQEGILKGENTKLKVSKDKCLSTFKKEYDNNPIEDKNYQYMIAVAEENKNKIEEELKQKEELSSKVEKSIQSLKDFKDIVISEKAELVTLTDESFTKLIDRFKGDLENAKNKIAYLDVDIKNTISELKIRYNNEVQNKDLERVINDIAIIFQNERNHEVEESKLNEESIGKLIDMLEKKIVELEQAEQKIESEFNAIADVVAQHADKLYDELRTIDRSSRINGKKLFQLDIKAEFNSASVKVYLSEISDTCLGREPSEKNRILRDNITSAKILDSVIPLSFIRASVIKFNALNETKTIPYENIHTNSPNFECSGAQRTIISFVILQCILHYTNENIISESKKTSSLMFLDNPFAVMSTKEMLDVFFDIADKFKTQLYCWTDIAKPEIIKMFKNIYSVQIVKYSNGQKEQLIFEENQCATEGITADNFKEDSFVYNDAVS
jgi:hypothetical protein